MDDMATMDDVEFSGFKGVDEWVMSTINSEIGKHIKRFNEICPSFEKLTLKMKAVHAQVHSEKFEIHASLASKGKLYTATTTDQNIVFAVTAALEKIEKEMNRKACPA